MIADNHGNESAVGTSAEDAYPQHEEDAAVGNAMRCNSPRPYIRVRAVGIAEQRNEGDPDRKQRHQLLRRAASDAVRVEQPQRDANQQQSQGRYWAQRDCRRVAPKQDRGQREGCDR